jgi:hypothetical protein
MTPRMMAAAVTYTLAQMAPADELLRSIPMFRRVSAEDRQRILDVARVRHFERSWRPAA